MKKLAFAAFAALIALVSCNKEIAPKEEVPAVNGGATITIKARSTEVKTNIVATQSGDEWTYKAHWNDEGESLGLILFAGDDFAASDVPVELAGSKSGNDMIFSGSNLDFEDGTYNIFLFYPFEAYQSSADGFIVGELKASQSPVKGSIDPKGDLLGYIDGDLVIDGGQAIIEDVELQRINTILRINLNAEEGDIAYGEVVTGLKMEVPSALPLAGKISIESDGGFDIVESASAITASIAAEEQISIGAAGDDNAVYLVTLPVTIPQDSPITFTIETTAHSGENAISRTVTAKEAMSLREGKVNTIDLKVRDGDIEDARYAGGTGIEGDPWLIATPQHMLNMAEDLVQGETKYFKLIDDIDMTGIEWPRLNTEAVSNKYNCGIDLDGDNHTITGLKKALFYVLKGSVKNLTIDKSDITERGVLAEYIQQDGNVITNVNVTDSDVNYDGDNVGGLVGHINKGTADTITAATFTNCSVSGTDVTGKGIVGGLIGFAEAKVEINGCTYSGGVVKSTANRFIGGLIASVANFESVISDCHVEDATINATVASNDFRAGGLIGQIQLKVVVKGCSVGTADKSVNLILAKPASGKVYNSGGFVGVHYGTITKNGDVRNSCYINISAASATGNAAIQLGGFAGYNTNVIEYSDAVVSATAITGSVVGGFAGYTPSNANSTPNINNCTVTGAISGTQKTGGFVGLAENVSISDCTASTIVTKVGSATGTGEGCDFGGFVGEATQNVTITKCCSDKDININASYVGGFAGSLNTVADKTCNISKCYSSGNVKSSSSQTGGFIGHIAAKTGGTVKVEDCFVSGDLIQTNQRQGDLIGQINSGIVTISRCYASGKVNGSFGCGGLIGFMNGTATVEDCAAWNSSVTPTSYGNANWSTGAVIGVAWPVATLTNNFRSPSMALTAWWVPDADYDHPDVSASSPLVVKDKSTGTLRATTATAAASGQDNYPQFAYHGKHVAAGTSLSTLASTAKASGGLGWSADIWDFSGPLPLLK